MMDLDKGVVIEPQYDSYEFDGKLHFFNDSKKVLSIDLDGNTSKVINK